MTRDECKNTLINYVTKEGGIRLDQLVSVYDLYKMPGFSEAFHPEMINELLTERKLGSISYKVGDRFASFLVPPGLKINLTNLET